MRTHESRWIACVARFVGVLFRIKSPQLYQLSYRPKSTFRLGKRRAGRVASESIVSPVYPNGSGEPSDESPYTLDALRRSVPGGCS